MKIEDAQGSQALDIFGFKVFGGKAQVFFNSSTKGGQKQKWKIFLLSNMKERFKKNRMSHFLPFYNDFFVSKFNFIKWIFHSVVICGPEF